MRRHLLPLAALAAILAPAPPAARAGKPQANGLEIRLLSSPSPGRIQVAIAAGAPHDAAIGASPSARDFTVWLDQGAAKDLAVVRNGARGKPLTSIFLVDESGSYKRGAGASEAIPAIYEYVKSAAGDELALVVFSTATSAYPVRTSPQDFFADVDAAGKRPAGPRTNLIAGLTDAIALASAEGEHGLREVVLFTDAGDEALISDATWRDVIARARDEAVRVSVVVPANATEPAGVRHDAWLATLNNLKQLTVETSGVYHNTGDPAQIAARLTEQRAAAKSWLVLEAGLCGMKSGQGVDVRVEYVPRATRVAWSDTGQLQPTAWTPGSDAPCPSLCGAPCAAWQECIGGTCVGRACTATETCPGGAVCQGGKCEKACAKPCQSWQECKAGTCVARACTAAETCGRGATCKGGACAPIAAPWLKRNLPWLLGAGAILLLGLAAALFLRKKPPVEEPVALPAPPEPAPAPEPEAPAGTAVALDPLPETHLVALGGWVTPGERWRLCKPRTLAGGSTDPLDAVDLVFAIKQVSSKHALFELYPSGDLWVTDLGARNGTFVNGRRLAERERAKLVPGDQVRLSQQLLLQVERPGAAPVRAAEAGADEATAAPQAPGPAPAPAPAPADGAAKKKTRFDPGNR